MLIELKWALMMCEPQGSPLKKKLIMVAPQEIADDFQQLQLYSGCWCSSNSTEVLSKGVTPALPLRHKKDQNNDAANYTFKEMAAKDLLVAELLSPESLLPIWLEGPMFGMPLSHYCSP